MKYFGTDGIRGRMGEEPITPTTVMKLGWALGNVLGSNGDSRGKIIIGKDTRVSGYLLESAMEAGLISAGVDVSLLGPMPTPGIAYLTRTARAQAGVVISASHNPYYDNGIKFFSASGSKLADRVEHAIEDELEKQLTVVASRDIGKVVRVVDAAGRYIEFCKATVPEGFNLRGLRIVVDCANGATYHIAPSVLSELGAEVIAVGTTPDGFNINDGVGSTDPRQLAAMVVEQRADLGIAYDGDGDRVLFVDNTGELVDGDELIYIIAMHRLATGKSDAGVVGTLMSNLGLEVALREQGLQLQRAKVGDRYVKELMEAQKWALGGESSGHIICSDVTTTGDGIVASLQVLLALRAADTDLATLKSGMTKYPQTMINVPVAGKPDLSKFPELDVAVAAVEQQMGDRGRVLLRPSGTEPLVRVMIEGEDPAEVATLCNGLAEQVAAILG